MKDIMTNTELKIKINEYFSNEDVKKFLSKVNNINSSVLFKSSIHGLYHSEKVLLFSYLIGKHYGFNDIEMEILMDAAIYHDIGRTNDDNYNMHGYASSYLLSVNKNKIVNNPIYDEPVNFAYLRAICDAHSMPDSREKRIFDNYAYEVEGMDYEEFSKLCKALKDADALDRTRFKNASEASLKEVFLRYDYSKKLISFAKYVNMLYLKRDSEKNYQKYYEEYGQKEESKNEYACFHGIGTDFFKLESILDNGILSSYARENENIQTSRNFNGSNGNLWISVVDDSMIHSNDSAFQKYIKNGISLYCFVPKFKVNNDENTNLGDINNKNEHKDEKYVFDKISKEQIHSIVIPNDLMNMKVDELNYLICSTNYNIILANVVHYKEELVRRRFTNFDVTNVKKLLSIFETKVKEYEKKQQLEQQLFFKEFIGELDELKSQINTEVQLWMKAYYKELFKTEGVPTVKDVIKKLMNKYYINGIYNANDLNETVIILNQLEFVKEKQNSKN